MAAEPEKRLRWWKSSRGSALILTLLILLVLSALGMMALRDVSRSSQQSGVYRMRVQAQSFADSVAQFMSQETGDEADTYWARMKAQQQGESKQLRDDDKTELEDRMAGARRGYYTTLTQKGESGEQGLFPDYFTPDDGETGLFWDENLGLRSFESREDYSEFGVVIRDPIDGPRMPGYDENFCFKKVNVATRGYIGDEVREWDGASRMADRRSVVEALIGPIDCGSR